MIITRQAGDELTKDRLAILINNFSNELLEGLGQTIIMISNSNVIFDPEEAKEFVKTREIDETQKVDLYRYIRENKNFGCGGVVYIPKVKLLIEDWEIITKAAGIRRMLHPFIFRKFISLYRFDCAARYLSTCFGYHGMPQNVKSLFDCVSHLQEISYDIKNIGDYFNDNPEKFRTVEAESVEEYIHKLRANVGEGVRYDFDERTIVEEDLGGRVLFLKYYDLAKGDTKSLHDFVGEVISKYKRIS